MLINVETDMCWHFVSIIAIKLLFLPFFAVNRIQSHSLLISTKRFHFDPCTVHNNNSIVVTVRSVVRMLFECGEITYRSFQIPPFSHDGDYCWFCVSFLFVFIFNQILMQIFFHICHYSVYFIIHISTNRIFLIILYILFSTEITKYKNASS